MQTVRQPGKGCLFTAVATAALALTALSGCAVDTGNVQTGVYCVVAKKGGPAAPDANASDCKEWRVGPTPRERERVERGQRQGGTQ